MDRRTFLQWSLLASSLPWTTSLVSAAAPQSPWVYALRGDGKVVVIDPAKEQIAAVIETGGKGGGLGSLTMNGQALYVANNAPEQRTVTIIDTRQLRVLANVETGNRPKHPVASPNGKWVAVNHSAPDQDKLRIAFFDATEHRLAKTIELPLKNSSHKGDFTMHGSWSSDSQWYAIGSYADNVAYFIEAATGRIVTLPLSGNPHYFDWHGTTHVFVTVEADEPKSAESRPAVVEVRFDPKNGVAEAVNTLKMTLSQAELSNPAQIEGHHANLTPDGKRIICCNRGAGGTFGGGSVDLFDVKSGKLVKHFELSLNGAGHAYLTPNGRYAVITQYNDTKLPVIDLQNLRVVTTIDAETGGHLGHAAFTDDGKCFVNNRKADEVLVISTRSWQITNRIRTGNGGQAQAMVLNRPYAVFERVGKRAFL